MLFHGTGGILKEVADILMFYQFRVNIEVILNVPISTKQLIALTHHFCSAHAERRGLLDARTSAGSVIVPIVDLGLNRSKIAHKVVDRASAYSLSWKDL